MELLVFIKKKLIVLNIKKKNFMNKKAQNLKKLFLILYKDRFFRKIKFIKENVLIQSWVSINKKKNSMINIFWI